MKNKLTFAGLFIVCGAAITGLFYLIFRQFSIAMICCSVNGALFFGVLFARIFLLSSKEQLNIKNVVVVKALVVTTLLLFLWTLLFVFALGDYNNAEQDLTILYIGYLVLFVFALLYIFMARHSTSTAEANNAAMQPCLTGKADVLALLQKTCTELANTEAETTSENRKNLSTVFLLAKSMPARVFEDEANTNLLEESVNAVSVALKGTDKEAVAASINALLQTIKTIR